MTRAVLVILGAICGLSGCKVLSGSATVERPPPALCLTPPAVAAPCLLPAWWDTASPPEKAGLELQCKALDSVAIRERDARLADCAAWFAASKGPARR